MARGSARTVRRRARENLAYVLIIGLVLVAAVAWNRWQEHRGQQASASTQPAPTPAAGGPATTGPLAAPGNPAAPPDAQPVTVAFPLDGDSLQVSAPAAGAVIATREPVQIRLIGIDAPETHGAGGQPQCYAEEAYRHLRDLAPAESTLLVTADRQARDPYDRYLVYAWTRDGTLVNLDQARLGYAKALEVWPNDAYAAAIGAAVADAHQAGRGLWGACGAP
jgi:micrococcal nuclease